MSVVAPAPPPGPTVAPRVWPAAAPARAAAVLAVLVAVLGGVLGPTGQIDRLLGAGAATVVTGTVEVLDAGTWTAVPTGTVLPSGTTLRAHDGEASLEIAGGGVDLADGAHVTLGPILAVQDGTVVVRGPEVVVAVAGVEAVGRGTWRVDAFGRIGSYDASTVVEDAAGREILVRGLQELRVRDGVAQTMPRPYVYVGDDPFDRTYLGPAFRVDDFVAALAGGLAATYGDEPQPAGFYTDFAGLDVDLVGLLGDVGFVRDGARVGPPADVLVAAVVTEALVTDAGLDSARAADEVRSLRVAGATWGLIAQARDLDAGHVRAAADRALARRQAAEEQGVATPVVEPTPPTPAPGEPVPGVPDDPDATDPDPDPDPDPGPDDPDDPEDPDPDEPGEEEPGTVGGIVEELPVEVEGPVGEAVDDVVTLVDDLIDGLGGGGASDGETGGGDGDAGGDSGGGLLGGVVDVVDEAGEAVEGLLGGLG